MKKTVEPCDNNELEWHGAMDGCWMLNEKPIESVHNNA